MAKSKKRPLATFPMKGLNILAKFILAVRTVVLNIGDHALIFVTPDPPLATVKTDTDDLEAAQAVAKTHVTGSAAARNLKLDIVLDDIHGLQGYVQRLADLSKDEPTAISIINASGFGLKNHGVRVKPDIAVKLTGIVGEVRLDAKSKGRKVMYEWQMSPDGLAWKTILISLAGHAVINLLPPETKQFFRVRAITKEGNKDWSPAVSIIVP